MNIDFYSITEKETIDLLTNHRYELYKDEKELLESILQLRFKNTDLELTGYTRYFRGNKEYYTNELQWYILRYYYQDKLSGNDRLKDIEIVPKDFEEIKKTLKDLENKFIINPTKELELEILINMMSYKEEDMW